MAISLSVETFAQPIALRFQKVLESTLSPATGGEDVLITDVPPKTSILHGFVDLSNLVVGDTVVLKEYVKIKPAGAYVLYAQRTYVNRPDPMCYVYSKPYFYGVRFSLTQTTTGVPGVYRDFDYIWFREI